MGGSHERCRDFQADATLVHRTAIRAGWGPWPSNAHGNRNDREVVDLGAPAGDPNDARPPLYLQQAGFGNPLGRGSVKPIAWR